MKEDLLQRQGLPLRAKVLMSGNRIREWYDYFNGDVCVSFSGGKDSTVLAHLVHDLYPDVPLVFANTGLEYPEIQTFARKMGAEFVYPKMRFDEVISRYGYPIISKEVAEAIHWARRIVPNSEGGDKETRLRQSDLQGNRGQNKSNFSERDRTEDCRKLHRGGGTQQQSESSGKCSTFRDAPQILRGGWSLNGQAKAHRKSMEAGPHGGEETSPG